MKQTKKPLGAYQKERIYDIPIARTVGAGGDFSDINDALEWASGGITAGSGSIRLDLLDGTHTIKYESAKASFNIQNQLSIYSKTFNANNVTVLLETDDTSNISIFSALSGGKLFLFGITFDFSSASLTGSTLATSVLGGVVNVFNSVIKGVNTGFTSEDYVRSTGCTFEDCDFACSVVAGLGGRAIMNNATLTNTPALGNTPTNEIQYDGSYISDNTAALSFKA